MPILLRAVTWLQLPLALIALGLWTYIASQIETLVQTRQELEQQVSNLRHEYNEKKVEVQTYQEQLSQQQLRLSKAREAVSLVSQAINFYHAHRYDEAVVTYDRALELDPENPFIHNLKGYSLFKAKKHNESVLEQKKAIDLDHNFAWAYFDMARAHCAGGQFAQAKHAIEKALELRPDLKTTMKEDGEFQRLCGKLGL